MTIAVAIGLTSAVSYVLLVLNDRRPGARRWSSDGNGIDAGGSSSGSHGFNLASWFSNTTTDVMGNPIDGGGDSGGDGGGGDGGGGD
ncbi:hypothetical protein SSBR45G_31200 [Bradyrhizobium sp. SSBR45G]|nr:hypothetical protein SSBR45G_31200 [Bradyrhizobium sp. SSBR45G]GLH86022.1 hypothetical protein SSBR45R_34820 [Bradyrhizobium sp. SSBR45R]